MTKFFKFILVPIVLLTIFFGHLALAQDADFKAGKSLVPCGNDMNPIIKDANGNPIGGGDPKNPCDVDDLFIMINTIIDFILKYLAVPIAAIMFAYAGIKLLLAGGESGQMSKAKEIFVNVALGLVFVAAAWLIVKLVLSTLGYTGWNPFA